MLLILEYSNNSAQFSATFQETTSILLEAGIDACI